MTVRRPARAEVVGSLLRPPELREAVKERSDPAHLGAVADAAIERVVWRQIDIGLDVVSDGEFRRWMFLNSFYDAVEGIATDRSAVEDPHSDRDRESAEAAAHNSAAPSGPVCGGPRDPRH